MRTAYDGKWKKLSRVIQKLNFSQYKVGLPFSKKNMYYHFFNSSTPLKMVTFKKPSLHSEEVKGFLAVK